MRKVTIAITLLAAGIVAAGCSTAIKESAGLALGAKGSVTPLQGAISEDASLLSAYDNFELGAFSGDMNGKVPAELFNLLPEAFMNAVLDRKLPVGGSKTLVARGKVLHYEDSSTVGMALGPVEFVVARVEFVDKSSGSVLGVANCVGRTTARVNLGVAKKAQGLARAIVKWIDARYPSEGRSED